MSVSPVVVGDSTARSYYYHLSDSSSTIRTPATPNSSSSSTYAPSSSTTTTTTSTPSTASTWSSSSMMSPRPPTTPQRPTTLSTPSRSQPQYAHTFHFNPIASPPPRPDVFNFNERHIGKAASSLLAEQSKLLSSTPLTSPTTHKHTVHHEFAFAPSTPSSSSSSSSSFSNYSSSSATESDGNRLKFSDVQPISLFPTTIPSPSCTTPSVRFHSLPSPSASAPPPPTHSNSNDLTITYTPNDTNALTVTAPSTPSSSSSFGLTPSSPGASIIGTLLTRQEQINNVQSQLHGFHFMLHSVHNERAMQLHKKYQQIQNAVSEGHVILRSLSARSDEQDKSITSLSTNVTDLQTGLVVQQQQIGELKQDLRSQRALVNTAIHHFDNRLGVTEQKLVEQQAQLDRLFAVRYRMDMLVDAVLACVAWLISRQSLVSVVLRKLAHVLFSSHRFLRDTFFPHSRLLHTATVSARVEVRSIQGLVSLGRLFVIVVCFSRLRSYAVRCGVHNQVGNATSYSSAVRRFGQAVITTSMSTPLQSIGRAKEQVVEFLTSEKSSAQRPAAAATTDAGTTTNNDPTLKRRVVNIPSSSLW